MIIPAMSEGYYLIQESGFWYVLKDEGHLMKRLLDSQGNEKRFEPTTESLAQAALYAQKHKDAGLHYDQEVSEP